MLDIETVKKKAIDFLIKSINQPWDLEPSDNDPLRLEAHLYLANKGIINKSEWGVKIQLLWDNWIKEKTSPPTNKLPEKEILRHSESYFWPAIESYHADIDDTDNTELKPGFFIENHLAMFRTKEVFSLPGYSEYFNRAKRELGNRLGSHLPFPFKEDERLSWQIVRSPLLRVSLNNPIREFAQSIIEERVAILESKPMVFDASISEITLYDIFFFLNTKLDDDHIILGELFLALLTQKQRKDGSFNDNVVETCLCLCSICLAGMHRHPWVIINANKWLFNIQKKNGSWQFHEMNEFSNSKIIKGEDIFLTVFVLETLDLISNDKPLPIWKNMLPDYPFGKNSQGKDHSPTVPIGIKWGDVSITFISDESVEIRAKSPLGVKNFIELGFKDRRAKGPNEQWGLLKTLAKLNGFITWKDKASAIKYKSHVKILRKRLREYFKIYDDPFYPYRSAGGYKAKFSITLRDEN